MTENLGIKLSKQESRINNLLNLLNKYRVLSIAEVSKILDVSTMTIRRDVQELEKKKILTLKNGILFISEMNDVTPIKKVYDLEKETSVQSKSKMLIGKYAASLIKDNETIVIDTGTTTEALVPYIDPNIKINVFCSNLNILNQLVNNPNIHVTFSGGEFHPNTQMFESLQSIDYISNMRANKVFISAAGVHEKLGLTCMNAHEVPTKEAIISSGQEHILLIDSSKFGNVHTSYFAPLNQIDEIVTDAGISETWKQIICDMNIRLHIVEDKN